MTQDILNFCLKLRAELAKPTPPQQDAPDAEKPVEPITTEMAMNHLRQALHDDLDYAWTWHCNIAMFVYDAGCPHDVANEGAARFMQVLAGVDTRKHPAFAKTQAELAKPKRCDLCGYQHGHQIGCANNPVDIALSEQAAIAKAEGRTE